MKNRPKKCICGERLVIQDILEHHTFVMIVDKAVVLFEKCVCGEQLEPYCKYYGGEND